MRKEWANSISDSAKRQGSLLRNIREGTGMTLRQLSMRVGISHAAISQLEHGKLELPRMRIEQIVLACGHSMADFDRMMGKGFVTPNYREECCAIIKTMDEEMLGALYKILFQLVAPNEGHQTRRLK